MAAANGHRITTLVVGWDGSAVARTALSVAARLAHGGLVVAVHAHQPMAAEATAHWQELFREDAAERSRALLSQIQPGTIDGAFVELRSVEGKPAEALQRVAREVGADAIVVGSRGLGATGAAWGSVSGALVEHADRPVMVIPPGLGSGGDAPARDPVRTQADPVPLVPRGPRLQP